MEGNTSYTVQIKFPGSYEYIAPIRKFVSEMLLVSSFNPKFAYRSEVIVDEICSNAIRYGCKSIDAQIELVFVIASDRFEVEVKDQGGSKEDVERLRQTVKNYREYQDKRAQTAKGIPKECLGLEIIKMLSEEVDLQVDENNITTLRVVRRKNPVYSDD